MRRVGVFGGTFDPPHLGHASVAVAAAAQLGLDEVLWVPAGNPYHKADTTPARTRAELVAAAVANLGSIHRVSRVDIDRSGPTYTVDTLEALATQRQGDQLVLIVGADTLAAMTGWRSPQRCCDLATIAATTRGAQPQHLALPAPLHGTLETFHVPTTTLTTLSSTLARDTARCGGTLDTMVEPTVAELIDTLELYQPTAHATCHRSHERLPDPLPGPPLSSSRSYGATAPVLGS